MKLNTHGNINKVQVRHMTVTKGGRKRTKGGCKKEDKTQAEETFKNKKQEITNSKPWHKLN